MINTVILVCLPPPSFSSQPDVRRDLPFLPGPLLLLSSAEDRWVLPDHAEAFLDALVSHFREACSLAAQ